MKRPFGCDRSNPIEVATSRRLSGPRREVLRLGLFLPAAATLLLAFGVSSAGAAPAHSFDRSFGAGYLLLAEHSGVAVDDATGDVYVADTLKGEVAEFEADGTFLRSFGSLPGLTFIAVDNSGGATDGSIYVGTYQQEAKVEKFEADGGLVTSWGNGGVLTPEIDEIKGLAVGPEGDLYLAVGNEFITPYEPDGTPAAPTFAAPRATAPDGIAADSAGDLYKVDGVRSVNKFSDTGEGIANELDGLKSAEGLGVDLSNDDLYVAHETSVEEGGEPVVRRFKVGCESEAEPEENGGECTPVETFGAGHLTDPQAVAVDSSTHTAYVADSADSEVAVFSFGPVTTTGAAGISGEEVTFTGEVEPEGLLVAECFFEYGPSSSYGASVPCEAPAAAEIPVGPGAVAVHATVRLAGGGDEHFRLVVRNAKGTGHGQDRIAHVVGKPRISAEAAAPGGNEALLTALLNPGNLTTTYHFEYGETASYGRSSASATVGAFGTSSEVASSVSDLQPGVTYHFRLVAENAAGVTAGPDQTFSTLAPIAPQSCPNEILRAENGSLGLPDCRAYERVTPAFQDGGQFANSKSYVLGASELDVLELGSYAGTQNSAPLGSLYGLNRSGEGWSPRPLRLPASQFQALGGGFEALQFVAPGGVSVQAARSASQPADAEELFRADAGGFTRVGAVDFPGAWQEPVGVETSAIRDQNLFGFRFLDSTLDGSHMLYGMTSPPAGGHSYLWPFDATAEGLYPSLYEYAGQENSEPLLVGVRGGQDSHDLISACGTSLGSYGGGDLYNAMSANGSTVFFTPSGEDRVGPCPGGVGAPPQTELYARVEGEAAGAHTVSISEPSRADCRSCQTEEGQTELEEAVFQGASQDGSRVFFLTSQELLPGNPGKNLYEYNFGAPPGEKVTAVSHLAGGGPADVLGVVRVSDDGSHVYFAATADLSASSNSTGATAREGSANLYVFDTETGQVGFVATLAKLAGSSSADSALWSEQDQGRPAEATPDGRYLVFASHAQLTPDDTSTVSQLFRYDAASGQLIRVSAGSRGFNSDGNSSTDPVTVPARFTKFGVEINGSVQKLISDDGSRIFFESSGGLTPRALDHQQLPHSAEYAENIYEWNAGEISLISDGRDQNESFTYGANNQRGSAVQLLGTSADARSVFFTTASPLVPGDRDTTLDIYDALSGGGISPRATAGCSGESCQASSLAPANQQAASSSFVGPGNPAARRQPRKRRQRRRHAKRRHHHHRKRRDHSSGEGGKR